MSQKSDDHPADTQAQQNNRAPSPSIDDDKKEETERHRKALKDLVQSWMDRLQLISVVTTFFASVEAGMLQITTPSPGDSSTGWGQASNATFTGALVMHSAAACISFLGAFALVKYKVKAAKTEEKQTEKNHLSRAVELEEANGRKLSPTSKYLWSGSNNNLVQVGPWRGQEPPVNLLSRCHILSIVLSALGFVLAFLGILCYTWDRQTLSVSIFTSCCMGISLIMCIWLLLIKNQDDSQIYAHI